MKNREEMKAAAASGGDAAAAELHWGNVLLWSEVDRDAAIVLRQITKGREAGGRSGPAAELFRLHLWGECTEGVLRKRKPPAKAKGKVSGGTVKRSRPPRRNGRAASSRRTRFVPVSCTYAVSEGGLSCLSCRGGAEG